MKKINLNFQINIRIIIFTISTLIFIYLLYLSIPSLYNSGRVQKVLSEEILNEFDLNLSLSSDISYRILPSPHYFVKDAKLFNLKKKVSNEIGELKELKIFISQKNLIDKNNLKITNLLVKNGNFFIKRDDIEFLSKFINERFSKKKINIKDSKLFFNDSENNTVFIYSIKKSNIQYHLDEDKNKVSFMGEIFKIPVNIDWEKDIDNKNKVLKINSKKINIDILNKSKFLKNKYTHENELNILNSKFKTKYEIVNGQVEFKSDKTIVKNTPINYSGIIELKPFFIKIDIDARTYDLNYFFKHSSWFNEIVKSKILQNDNLNGNILIKSDKLLKNKLFNKISLNLNVNQGNISFKNTVLYDGKIGKARVLSSNFYEKDDKIFLGMKVSLDIKNLNSFYKVFLIPKQKEKNLVK